MEEARPISDYSDEELAAEKEKLRREKSRGRKADLRMTEQDRTRPNI